MIKEILDEQLFNKIPDNAKIVIFGAGIIAQKMYNDIVEQRKDVKILGFIENKVKTNLKLPVWTLKEFIDKQIETDLVVFSTSTDSKNIINIFDVYDIPFLMQSEFVSNYYRGKKTIYNDKNYNDTIKLFKNEEDKKLFDIIFKLRADITNGDTLYKLYKEKYNKEDLFFSERIKYHYLDKINKNAVKTLIDVGMSYGINIIAFNKFLPNLKYIYGFETIYDKVKIPYIEDFINNDKLTIIPYAVGDKEGQTNFAISKQWSTCSMCTDITSMNENTDDWEHVTVDITTLDKYLTENSIEPDFIKMDIEGAELPALKGGIKCIKKFRPQLAISIYHSDEDFFNIPLYLAKNLENYHFTLGHYAGWWCETVLYAIPDELVQ